VQIDSTASEAGVAQFVKKTLEAEGIAVSLVARDPARPNIIARIKGNGTKKPFLIMGHSDTVKIDLSKWTFRGRRKVLRTAGENAQYPVLFIRAFVGPKLPLWIASG
jgi:acetylornithine deacetylase/succinyl-diaminopimelate desuccinylase-like protein